MTDEEILKIAEEHLYCNVSVMEWSGKNEDILSFARALFEAGCKYATTPGMWEV